jgi:DNA replication protein DnaC
LLKQKLNCRHSRIVNDEGESLNKLLYSVTTEADVLIWDDAGKMKWTEAKELLYYQIINERYQKKSGLYLTVTKTAEHRLIKSDMRLPAD